jgi:glycosyltransferase involved in cell wall biosynthesis
MIFNFSVFLAKLRLTKNGEKEIHMEGMEYCVIIPTYNNQKTLEEVICGVLRITKNIIVVNDGSTDSTNEILKKFSDLTIISYERNRGKGYAIQKGFEAGSAQGYSNAVTIDSDGQHFPEDILTIAGQIEKKPDTLIIGARNLAPEELSKGSSFANRFSNFWVRFLTGLNLSDTQTGFRSYPLKPLEGMRFYTRKYEFELEVLVRSAWKGINVESVPIRVFYPSRSERVSHFRPFMDFFRISILNTVFVIIALLYIKPFSFLKYFRKENLKRFIRDQILQSQESNLNISLAVALGIFTGIIPIWGFQLITAIALAHLFGLSKLITSVAANISIPPMIPIILYLSYVTGGYFLASGSSIKFSTGLSVKSFENNLFQYLIGSIAFAIILSIFAGIISYVILKYFRKRRLKTS